METARIGQCDMWPSKPHPERTTMVSGSRFGGDEVFWPLFIAVVLIAIVVVGIVIATAVNQVPATRPWAMVAALAIAAFPVSIVLHNMLSAVFGGEEAMSFIIALLIAPGLIAAGTLGVAVRLRRDARFARVGTSLAVAGAGLVLFAAYAVFALVVTAVTGGNSPYQAFIEATALALSAAAIAIGTVLAVVTRYQVPAATSSST
jgi:cytochrome b subunit of formate dehydrogenase